MSIIIEVSAEEMRKACDEEVDHLAIEIHGAIMIADARCAKCNADVADDIGAIKLNAIMLAAGWMHAQACKAIDAGEDFRKLPVQELQDKMMKCFSPPDKEAIEE